MLSLNSYSYKSYKNTKIIAIAKVERRHTGIQKSKILVISGNQCCILQHTFVVFNFLPSGRHHRIFIKIFFILCLQNVIINNKCLRHYHTYCTYSYSISSPFHGFCDQNEEKKIHGILIQNQRYPHDLLKIKDTMELMITNRLYQISVGYIKMVNSSIVLENPIVLT